MSFLYFLILFINYIYYIICFKTGEIINSEELDYNIIDVQKRNLLNKEKNNKNVTFILENEIKNFYNFWEEIPIYVSIMNFNKNNYIQIEKNNKNSYLSNYKKLLGKSDNFFVDNQLKSSMSISINLNKIDQKILSSDDDILLKEICYNQTGIIFFKNQFLYNFKEFNNYFKEKIFNFYDLNIIYNIDNNHKKNLTKIKNILILNDTENLNLNEDNFIGKFLSKNNYNLITNNTIINKKITSYSIINNTMSKILYHNISKINLKNYLLENQIEKVKIFLNEIEKELIYLIYYYNILNENEFFDGIILLENKINDLLNYLSNFNFFENNFKIDLCFYLITLIFLLLGIFQIFETIFHYKMSFELKRK